MPIGNTHLVKIATLFLALSIIYSGISYRPAQMSSGNSDAQIVEQVLSEAIIMGRLDDYERFDRNQPIIILDNNLDVQLLNTSLDVLLLDEGVIERQGRLGDGGLLGPERHFLRFTLRKQLTKTKMSIAVERTVIRYVNGTSTFRGYSIMFSWFELTNEGWRLTRTESPVV